MAPAKYHKLHACSFTLFRSSWAHCSNQRLFILWTHIKNARSMIKNTHIGYVVWIIFALTYTCVVLVTLTVLNLLKDTVQLVQTSHSHKHVDTEQVVVLGNNHDRVAWPYHSWEVDKQDIECKTQHTITYTVVIWQILSALLCGNECWIITLLINYQI